MDEVLTVLEYARQYGLSKDYTSYELWTANTFRPLDCDTDSVDIFELFPPVEFRAEPIERWSISASTASFLRVIAEGSYAKDGESPSSFCLLRPQLKFDQPLLYTDADLDYAHFRSLRLPDPLPPQEVPKELPNSIADVLQLSAVEEKWMIDASSLAFLCNITHPGKKATRFSEDVAEQHPSRMDPPLLLMSPSLSVDHEFCAMSPPAPVALPEVSSHTQDQVEMLESLSPVGDVGYDLVLQPLSPTVLNIAVPQDADEVMKGLKMEVPLLSASETPSPTKVPRALGVLADCLISTPDTADEHYQATFAEFVDLARQKDFTLETENLYNNTTSSLRMSVPRLSMGSTTRPWDARIPVKDNLQPHTVDHDTLRWRPTISGSEDRLDDLFDDTVVNNMIGELDQAGPLPNVTWRETGLRLLEERQSDADELDALPHGLEASELFPIVTPGCAPGGLGDLLTLDRFLEISRGIQPVTSIKAITEPTEPSQLSAIAIPEPVKPPHISLPEFDRTLAPASIVLSSGILSMRIMVRELASLLPDTELEEAQLSSVVEADIYIPPTSSVILATIMRLKQRPLPGTRQSSNPIHARIVQVSSSFKGKLTVLVSEGQPVPQRGQVTRTRPLDASDRAALEAVRTLVDGVEVVFVPGSERELAAWVAAQTCKSLAESGREQRS